jgi:phosphoglycolate phosphatase-like HAD superfamily hydrolase
MSFIAVDLDGTLAHSSRDYDSNEVGEPIAPMVDRVKKWIGQGKDVRIFTARLHEDTEEVRKPIREWCKKHLGKELPITNVKHPEMERLYDDRAVGVQRNTGHLVGPDPDSKMEEVKEGLRKIAK